MFRPSDSKGNPEGIRAKVAWAHTVKTKEPVVVLVHELDQGNRVVPVAGLDDVIGTERFLAKVRKRLWNSVHGFASGSSFHHASASAALTRSR
jgi:hypothetical protein